MNSSAPSSAQKRLPPGLKVLIVVVLLAWVCVLGFVISITLRSIHHPTAAKLHSELERVGYENVGGVVEQKLQPAWGISKFTVDPPVVQDYIWYKGDVKAAFTKLLRSKGYTCGTGPAITHLSKGLLEDAGDDATYCVNTHTDLPYFFGIAYPAYNDGGETFVELRVGGDPEPAYR